MSLRVCTDRLPSLFRIVGLCAAAMCSVGCGASGSAKASEQQGNLSLDLGGSTGDGGGLNGNTGGASGVAVKTSGGTSTSGTRATGGRTGSVSTTATGGTSTSSSLNPSITGNQGFATRYWDCCKPSCSWSTAVPACQKDGTTHISDRNAVSGCDSGGSAYECDSFAPWYDASTNLSYGFAAYNASGCGICYELQFTGESSGGSATGAAAIKGKQMIVQVINIGNIASGQFDLLIPGGGVGERTAGCTAQWGSVDLGVTYGGLLSECNNDAACMAGKCQSVFGSKATLLAGCNWFTGWFSSADNPAVIYKQVSCPAQITAKSGISG